MPLNRIIDGMEIYVYYLYDGTLVRELLCASCLMETSSLMDFKLKIPRLVEMPRMKKVFPRRNSVSYT